jgi:hypothetical protein
VSVREDGDRVIGPGRTAVGVVVATVVAVAATALAPAVASSARGAVSAHPRHTLKRSPPSRRRRMARPVSVSVNPAVPIGSVVPEDFLGLSFEAINLPSIAAYADSGDLVNLLRSLGPGVMRFGGISADEQTTWSQEGPAPAWAQATIDQQDLAGVAALAAASGWRVLLTVNLGHYEPAAAAQEAQVAQALLGPSLLGIAIGNEPDLYVADGLRASPWAFPEYLSEVDAYRGAIAASAPGVQIVGPDSSSSGELDLPWFAEAAADERPALLTEHYYPLTKCQRHAPTLGQLVSPLMRANETATLAQLATIARSYGIPLRLDETNNVSCRGQPGVSNVFASALWAVDYVVRAMASGVVGLNFHDLIAEPLTYSPLAAYDAQELAGGALHANPEFYALLLTRSLIGQTPVQARVSAGSRTLTAGAFVSASGNLHIVLVNFAPHGARRLVVRLRLPRRFGPGPILRLTAAGLRARTGVALGARSVGAIGTWTPSTPLPRVSGGPGSLELDMPPSSAALVTLYPTG